MTASGEVGLEQRFAVSRVVSTPACNVEPMVSQTAKFSLRQSFLFTALACVYLAIASKLSATDALVLAWFLAIVLLVRRTSFALAVAFP
jgi:hypothetical protein